MSDASARREGFRIERVGERIVHITLNRPERLNALTLVAMQALGESVRELGADPSVGCLVITGSGKAFCTGADLPAEGPIRRDPERASLMMDAARDVIESIVAAPFPVIAQVNGPAAGVGASIAFACDLVFAASEAYFFLPFTGIGLIPDGGASTTIAQAVGRVRAMRMILLNEKLCAQEAFDVGLIARVMPHDALNDEVQRTARRLAGGSTPALSAAKHAVNRATFGGHPALAQALDHETEVQCGLLGSADYEEGVLAFREKRRPHFPSSTPTTTPAHTTSNLRENS